MPKSKTRRPPRRAPRRRSRSAAVEKLPKNAVTLVVVMRAKEAQHLLLEAELRALVTPSRKEEGCLRFDLHRCTDQPGTFLFHEVWETREHHTAHTRTPHFLRWNARKDALVLGVFGVFWHQLA